MELVLWSKDGKLILTDKGKKHIGFEATEELQNQINSDLYLFAKQSVDNSKESASWSKWAVIGTGITILIMIFQWMLSCNAQKPNEKDGNIYNGQQNQQASPTF